MPWLQINSLKGEFKKGTRQIRDIIAEHRRKIIGEKDAWTIPMYFHLMYQLNALKIHWYIK
jgi:hypothetical protein